MPQSFRVTAETRIIKADSHVSCDLDGMTVMMSIADGAYLGLNRVGSRIWTYLDQEPRFSELLAKVTAEYSVDPLLCERDVRAFLEDLYQRELIRLENAE